MRIWSLHPKYLDTRGLVALWREALLARQVLEGNTNGYKNHPQLNRFKNAENAVDLIDQYLSEVYFESVKRKFKFDRQKINWSFKKNKVRVTTGQVKFEVDHLLSKLEKRDCCKYEELRSQAIIDIHPVFELTDGDIESWEIITKVNQAQVHKGPVLFCF